jgi:hypothetical protein
VRQDSYVFSGDGTLSVITRDFDSGSPDCMGSQTLLLVRSYKIIEATSSSLAPGAYEITLREGPSYATALVQETVDGMNRMVGTTDFWLGVPTRTNGLARSRVEGDLSYFLMRFDQGLAGPFLQIGDSGSDPGYDGSTPEKRPTQLQGTHFQKNLSLNYLHRYAGVFKMSMNGQSCFSNGAGGGRETLLLVAPDFAITDFREYSDESCVYHSGSSVRIFRSGESSAGPIAAHADRLDVTGSHHFILALTDEQRSAWVTQCTEYEALSTGQTYSADGVCGQKTKVHQEFNSMRGSGDLMFFGTGEGIGSPQGTSAEDRLDVSVSWAEAVRIWEAPVLPDKGGPPGDKGGDKEPAPFAGLACGSGPNDLVGGCVPDIDASGMTPSNGSTFLHSLVMSEKASNSNLIQYWVSKGGTAGSPSLSSGTLKRRESQPGTAGGTVCQAQHAFFEGSGYLSGVLPYTDDSVLVTAMNYFSEESLTPPSLRGKVLKFDENCSLIGTSTLYGGDGEFFVNTPEPTGSPGMPVFLAADGTLIMPSQGGGAYVIDSSGNRSGGKKDLPSPVLSRVGFDQVFTPMGWFDLSLPGLVTSIMSAAENVFGTHPSGLLASNSGGWVTIRKFLSDGLSDPSFGVLSVTHGESVTPMNGIVQDSVGNFTVAYNVGTSGHVLRFDGSGNILPGYPMPIGLSYNGETDQVELISMSQNTTSQGEVLLFGRIRNSAGQLVRGSYLILK